MSSEHPSEQVKHLLQDCLGAARRQDYAAALAAVNDALKACNTDKSIPVIHVLEHRVAVYLRMNLLDQALKDAKAMIRLDPTDARGYIRSGITECRKNNKAAAMRFFEYGLKKVPNSDANHVLLVKEMKKTAEQIRTEIVLSQAKDPLSALPLEVVELVLSFLDYRSIIRLLRVSRSWNKIVSNADPVISTLYFPSSAKQISPKLLSAAIKRCRTLKTVKLPQLPGPTAQYLVRALERDKRFSELQDFEWRDVQNYPAVLSVGQFDLRVIIVESSRTLIPHEWAYDVLRNYRSLEVGKFQYMSTSSGAEVSVKSSSLREYELRCGRYSSLCSDRISFEFPELRTLSYKGIRYASLPPLSRTLDLSQMTKLRSLDLVDAELHSINLPPSLKQLKLASCRFVAQPCDPALPYPTLNELEELRVDDCDFFPTFVLYSIQKTQPGKLLKFSVTANEQVAQHLTSIMSMPWFRSLKSLRIANANFISLDDFSYIKSCPALEELCLEQAENIGAFVSDLIREAAQLRKVTLRDCFNVARDIIAWAKARGVEVEITQQDFATGSGRHVVEIY
ncbi:uncharacterized protein PV07_02466 [Cladophialophora immunda]|uniref:F-box domain-containing protein n=1 Tax=Cladophialophora immunda TaxID=569365 RepID=A0A0D2D515_9EURO|nr:uncharacterized protein PV07_02466 [Cladophialophora immunda]KIW30764.1 hypothetical protein PV07_02466 [Cladophialophora immunda]